MMKNPVMFVVEVGCIITLILCFVPNLFGTTDIQMFALIILLLQLFCLSRFCSQTLREAVAEGRGKAQAASLKKTQKIQKHV